MNLVNQNQSVYSNSSIKIQALLMLCAAGMALVSLYLLKHYFETVFPGGVLQSGKLCNLSGFFNCDATTLSSVSRFFGVPIALPGFLMGAMIFTGFFFKNRHLESSIFFILTANIAGCLFLLFYSLFVIKSVCPFCLLYYIFSLGAFLIFLPYRKNYNLHWISLAVLIAIGAGTMALMKMEIKDKEKDKMRLATSLVEQFDALPRQEKMPETPYFIHKATDNFTDAPIQMIVFSDFQCPACKMLSDLTHRLLLAYRDNINMKYYFYPLDMDCNASMNRPLHPLACKAAYMASCGKNLFREIHDSIFNNQQKLSREWIDNYAKETGTLDCMNNPNTQKKVKDMVSMAATFKIRSTPTIFLNGVKIEGLLSFSQMTILFDELIRRHGKAK